VLCELQHLPPTEGLFVREYSPAGMPTDCEKPRMYFTAENASKIDAISGRIADWEKDGLLTQEEHSLLRHDLILATNRIANIAGTYGHYRSSWTSAALSPLALKPNLFIPEARTDHTILQGYAEELAPSLSVDLCYLDPPYMKRQYAANYHIPETLARGDQPSAVGVSGLRPWRDQYSNFCSKVKIREAFAAIIEPMDCQKFLISYSEDGLLSLDELTELLTRFGTVDVRHYEYPRFRSNQSSLSATLHEFLFSLVKRK
jgi:adenine-specific DNA-methyltransferase